MKKIFLILSLGFILSCSVKPRDKYDYFKALEYIKNIKPYKTEGVYVVDTLFYISRITFSEDLLKGKNSQRGHQILDSLENIDRKFLFDNKISTELRNINSNKNGKFNLYFSKQQGSTIEFELLDNKGDVNNSHNYLTMFSTGHIYSISVIDGKIKVLNSLDVIYD
ncbi:MAG: hypothetical protein BM557_07920 [Flavobacterium sp. MedPE-SWcel]|uniref:hypothetical protein n=1 Tax=uncultured Flavobacterium sp. TaxID=165435 RepID=UPI000923F669|nr:hypothetical protein [uncultured Flavobacterium sp.]OIQ18130.1 MAG: hypothetical protein BM557_07920 [Flavobacterium sp. MedPE-SWcel]